MIKRLKLHKRFFAPTEAESAHRTTKLVNVSFRAKSKKHFAKRLTAKGLAPELGIFKPNKYDYKWKDMRKRRRWDEGPAGAGFHRIKVTKKFGKRFLEQE